MTNKELYNNLESKVDTFMLPILAYFEQNSNENYETLKAKWVHYSSEINNKRIEIIFECITDTGIDISTNNKEDLPVKYFIIQVFPDVYDDLINKFYNEKIYPIIIKRFKEGYLISSIQ